MTGNYTTIWRIESATPPEPYRHCATCGGVRGFQSSGKVRLNANGRRLDAWLIYKCMSCDRTWNLPFLEREAVQTISAADLQAMQESDPDWVRMREFDLARLVRYCDRVEHSSAVSVQKEGSGDMPVGCSVVELKLQARFPVSERLDRLLARELGLSRSGLQAMVRTGALELGPAGDRALRKAVGTGVTLLVLPGRMEDRQRGEVLRGILGGGGWSGPGAGWA